MRRRRRIERGRVQKRTNASSASSTKSDALTFHTCDCALSVCEQTPLQYHATTTVSRKHEALNSRFGILSTLHNICHCHQRMFFVHLRVMTAAKSDIPLRRCICAILTIKGNSSCHTSRILHAALSKHIVYIDMCWFKAATILEKHQYRHTVQNTANVYHSGVKERALIKPKVDKGQR